MPVKQTSTMDSSIDSTARIFSNVELGDIHRVGPFSILGEPTRVDFQNTNPASETSNTIIQDDCYIGSHVIIYQGAVVEKGTAIEEQGVIESGVQIGQSSYIVYGAQLGANSKVGDQCVIGGFVAERTEIGKRSRIFGSLLHRHHEPHLHWDENIEPSPTLGDNVIVGFNSSVIGDIDVGNNVYITANALVTEDVPPETIVTGRDNKVPIEEWQGPLSDTPYLSTNGG